MSITARLQLAAVAPVLMAVVIGLALVASYQFVAGAEQKDRIAQRIMRGMHELNDLAVHYMLHQDERPKQQFLLEQEAIRRLVAGVTFADGEQQQIVDRIRGDNDSLRASFLRLAAHYERHRSAEPTALVKEAEERLAGHLLIRTRDVVSAASRLERLIDEELVTIQRRISALVASLSILTAVAVSIILIRTTRSITTSLRTLREGTETVGAGNLDHTIGMSARDEIGLVARSFDRMTERLRDVIVSKDELQREVAERQQAEEALRRTSEALRAAKDSAERAKAAAEEASRAKDHFLAVLSHELRTPLSPVLTGIALLQRDPTLSERARGFLDIVRRNVELESRLIDDLLDLSRIARGKVELDRRLVELHTVIDRAVEVCRPDIDARHLHFGVDFGPRPVLVHADAARLQQVFWNVLENAIKFTPHGGCVGLRCQLEDACMVVEVQDSGIGIEPAALERIFDAFAQAERSITRQFGGLGLGLAISKALVEAHGGTIEAHSDGPGCGATFRVRLPVISADARPVTEHGTPRARLHRPPTRRPLRILLVEDHGDTAEMIVLMLELEGHRVQRAGDLATALDLATRESFDVLISDLGLPDGSGLDLVPGLRSRGRTLPAIALSGFGHEHDIERSRAAGFQAHLVKPVDGDRLLEVLHTVVARSDPGGPA